MNNRVSKKIRQTMRLKRAMLQPEPSVIIPNRYLEAHLKIWPDYNFNNTGDRYQAITETGAT